MIWGWVVAAFGWAAAVGLALVIVHGGTRDRSNGPKPERPAVGADVTEIGPNSADAGEPPSHSR